MLTKEEFRKEAYAMVDRILDYYDNIDKYPVKSQVAPGEVFSKLPRSIPLKGEGMEHILADFDKIIMPGITHWQSPNFYAYFPANSSYASQLGEMLMTAIGAQCMKWETSPAAAELEEMVMIWLRDILGLPDTFTGVIQDTASGGTLCAMLTARERYSEFNINKKGFPNQKKLRVYCSQETHSSIEKGIKEKLRNHMTLAKDFEEKVRASEDFKIMAPVNFNLVCFQFNPEESKDHQIINILNKELMDSINKEGRIYLTHTKLKGDLVLRMAIGQTNVASEHIEKAWNVIVRHASMIRPKTT